MAESPVWKRPSDVMKIHRRRKSVTQKRITTDPANRTSVIYKSPSKPVKRRNPFSCHSPSENPSKRQNLDNKETSRVESNNCELFGFLDSATPVNEIQDNHKKGQNTVDTDGSTQLKNEKKKLEDTSNTLQNHVHHKPSRFQPDTEHKKVEVVGKKDTEIHPYIPVDWCLKTKLRVVSSRPLNWCCQLKSTEEAHGVTSYVQQHDAQMVSTTEQKQLFQRGCMYWIHPNIPWMKLFPRIIDDSTSSKTFSPLMQEDIQKSLQTDWAQSFTSAYHQLRAGLCPYFYLCTHQFTVVFHEGDQSGIVALVTPTTRGFRELLDTEGIAFTLPVGSKGDGSDISLRKPTPEKTENNFTEDSADQDGNKDVTKTTDDCVDDDDDDDLLQTDDAASGWLESMGLDKKEFPSLDPKNVKLQREGFRVIDHRPESLVYIEGSDVQAFFNFLLNCRSCTATSGQQAGLPATILSPSPFKGATLKSHKVKHTAVKQSDREGNISHAHIVEMTGPIMPQHSSALVSLYHHTQQTDFGMVYNNHDPTVPFNVLPQLCTRLDSNKVKVTDSHHGDGNHSNNNNTDSNHGNHGDTSECGSDNDTSTCGDKNVTDNSNKCKTSEHFRNVAIADRICAIKELVCTPDGFTWNT